MRNTDQEEGSNIVALGEAGIRETCKRVISKTKTKTWSWSVGQYRIESIQRLIDCPNMEL